MMWQFTGGGGGGGRGSALILSQQTGCMLREGGGGEVSLDTFTGKGCKVGEREGGSVLIRCYPLTKDKGRFLQHRFVQS